MPRPFDKSIREVFNRYRSIIDDWPLFRQVVLAPLPICIWTNTLRIRAKNLAAILADDGITVKPLSWYDGGYIMENSEVKPGKQWSFLAGLYHIQEQVSLIPVTLLAPQPGERVLDLCAAPGNKTAQAAVAMATLGNLIANDVSSVRMRALRQIIERLGLCNIITTSYDGANFPKSAGLFDKVLVDVPCSCEGTTRKNPEVLHHASAEVSGKMARVQRALLRKAVELCRPGGRIVYSSCTYAPEENEMVIDSVLKEYGQDRLRVQAGHLKGLRTSPGLTTWNKQHFHPSLKHAMRIWPHQNNTGGFFLALLEKGHDNQEKTDRESTRIKHSQSQEQGNIETSSSCLLPFMATEKRDAYLGLLHERFGIPPARFDRYGFYQRNRKHVYVAIKDLQPLKKPQPQVAGMMFMHVNAKHPKLTTAAAIAFGTYAEKNIVPLNRQQIEAFLSRQRINLSAANASLCYDKGYVLIQYQGFILGVGFYRPDKEGAGGVIESLFPKGWALN